MFFKKKEFRRPNEVNVDSSAIGDMAFLLLIFFIVTSAFLIKKGMFLSLPSLDAGSVKVEEERLFEIEPTSEAYLVDGRAINETTLREAMQKKQNEIEDLIVVIYMGPEILYSRLIDTLSIAKELRIHKISIKDSTEKL